MARYILDTMMDWPGSGSAEELQTLTRATEATTLDTLAALVSGDDSHLTESFEPLENVGSYIRNQIPLPEVVRNVHTGQEFLIQELIDAAAREVSESQRVDTISRLTKDVTAFWSAFIARIAEEYHRQQGEWLRNADGQRARLVRSLLRAGETDEEHASKALGYDLSQCHVGCLLWFDGVDLDAVRLFDFAAIAREIAAATGSRSYLPLPTTAHRLELWLGEPAQPVAEVLAGGRWPSSLRAAVGTPQRARRGFTQTHAEAEAAAQVLLRSAGTRHVIDYADVELLSLLTADFDRAAAFVRRTLGPIAVQDTRSEELRETLAAWIDCSGSIAATSQRLYLHRNTVSYRLRQLDELLGQHTDNTRLRCALTIVEWMPQVLVGTD